MTSLETPVITGTRSNAPVKKRKGGYGSLGRLSRGDRIAVSLMLGVPTLLVLWLVWVPAVLSVVLSFASWQGIGGIDTIRWIGFENYKNVFTNYPPFAPALEHNVIWLAMLFVLATPLGVFLAVLLDKEMKGGRFYQSALFLPVVLSLALVGFMWQLIYSQDQGLLNAVTGSKIDWYGDPKVNLWAVLVATCWRQTGYVMLLYLAGLKAVDPSLREAAKVDGASETQTFFRVVLPVMRPINIVVLVITFIEALRAFDIVWVVNKGRNGLELISTLVTSNIIGEASRIGFGSALATIMLAISSVFVALYLRIALREDKA
ncbi:MAG: multiple sugar transport system permease protein [Actinomycetota bacterium]|jgi:multiple sugar transport system permease protein|nr:multiple sugar transport system permease protein [Actinomycetota bacterium]